MARGPIGVSRRRRSARPPERADDLAGLVLSDDAGEERRLGDMWRDGPAVLVFLRHYG